MSTTRLVDADPMALSVANTIKAARELREKHRDVPVSIKMSRETWRHLVIIANILPSKEPQTHFMAMPIIFDEEIPVGEVKAQFAVEDCCGECGGVITDDNPHGACMDSAAGRSSLK